LLQQKRQSQENPSFLDAMNRFGDITEREIDENVIGSVTKNQIFVSTNKYLPKTRKRARTVFGDSLCHFAPKKSTHLI
jgi:hypothetical protein